MKTALPTEIKTIRQAAEFLYLLHVNGESYHPEDNAEQVVFPNNEEVTDHERTQLNKLMRDIYNLPGNSGMYPDLKFDPCEFQNIINPVEKMEATNFDVRISKQAALQLLSKRPNLIGYDCLKDAIGFIEVMCKEYGDDDEWVGLEHSDYEVIEQGDEYQTFELWITPPAPAQPTPEPEKLPRVYVVADANGGNALAVIPTTGDVEATLTKALRANYGGEIENLTNDGEFYTFTCNGDSYEATITEVHLFE